MLYKAMKPLMMPADVDRHELWQLASMLGFHEVSHGLPLPDNVTPLPSRPDAPGPGGLSSDFLSRARAFQATGIDPAMPTLGGED